MSQFSSRPRFNDDPSPWRAPNTRNLPRPEFDRPQTNPTNPILWDFRESHGNAAEWVDVLCGRDGDVFLAGTPKEMGRVSADHVSHALAVLSRLARLREAVAS